MLKTNRFFLLLVPVVFLFMIVVSGCGSRVRQEYMPAANSIAT
jgi:hypothetical protein